MCDPATMMVMSGILQYQGSMAAASGTRQVAANNAKLLDYQRGKAGERGKRRLEIHQQNVSDQVGGQKVSIAGGGITVGQDSAADVITDTTEAGAIDAMMIRADTEGEVYALGVQKQSLLAQADIDSSYLRTQGMSSLLAATGQAKRSYNAPTVNTGTRQYRGY